MPAWAFPGWKDRYFSERPSRLASYATVFDTVEGNTTFYRTPDAKTVDNWRAAVDGSNFRFCFKLPRDVTHEKRPDLPALKRFLDAIRPMGEYLGPFLVQFPATVGPEDIEHFEDVFAQVRALGRLTIEVRHKAFFEEPELLEPVLERYEAGRVMLDSRPLYEGDRNHPEVLDALHEKPDVPVLATVYNDVALVRLILHPDIVSNDRYIAEWADHSARWIRDGVDVFMMIHCPNNLHCPPLALEFHEQLRRQSDISGLEPLPGWPIPQQQSLL